MFGTANVNVSCCFIHIERNKRVQHGATDHYFPNDNKLDPVLVFPHSCICSNDGADDEALNCTVQYVNIHCCSFFLCLSHSPCRLHSDACCINAEVKSGR